MTSKREKIDYEEVIKQIKIMLKMLVLKEYLEQLVLFHKNLEKEDSNRSENDR